VGLLFIFLAVFCSLLLAHLLKTIEHARLSRIRVLTVNYLIACITAVLHSYIASPPLQSSNIPPEILGIAFWLGVMFIVTFFIFSKSIDVNGVGVSVTAMRISLVLPVIAGLLVFNESTGYQKIAGIILILFSLAVLIPLRKKAGVRFNSDSLLLVLIFLITGTNDILLKFFEHYYALVISETWFASILFFVSFISGVLYIAFTKKYQFVAKEIGYGALIGIINLYSTVFLLYALRYLEASIVFPAINISVVVGGTIVGIYAWKDKLDYKQWLGLLLACIGLILIF